MITKEKMLHKVKMDPEAIIDVHTHVGINANSYVKQGYPYCLSLEDLAIRMKTLGISYSVVFPFGSLYYSLTKKMEEKVRVTSRLSRFPYEIANQNLMNEVFEIFPQYSKMFFPFAMFDPMRKQVEQVKLLRKLASRFPLYGLKTVTSYTQAYVKGLLTKEGREIIDFAEELNIPIIIHTSVAPGDPWANVFDILDVVSASPDVRFCLAHTCRFNKKALDAAHEMENCFVDLSAFNIHCQLAVQNSHSIAKKEERFPADYTKPIEAMKMLTETYPKTLCWGTDTPAYYYINRWVDKKGVEHGVTLKCDWNIEVETLKRLDQATIHTIAYNNPLGLLFGI